MVWKGMKGEGVFHRFSRRLSGHSIPGSTVAFLEKVGPHGWPLALKLLRGLRCMRDDGGVLPKVATGRKRWDLD